MESNTKRLPPREAYRAQLARLARAMAVPGQEADLPGELLPLGHVNAVQMFVSGNAEKRFDKLQRQLEFVAEGIDDLDEWIVRYQRDVPLSAYDSGTSDGRRMLEWLVENCPLTPRQRDYVACQQARHEIEELARSRRLQHVRFQEMRSLVNRWLGELESNDRLQVFLNPVRVWARFETDELLDDDAALPGDVLFFADHGEVATAVLELEGQALVNLLADLNPCTLAEWAAHTPLADRGELAELGRDLSGMGLVALG
jgi:hypothetical protein